MKNHEQIDKERLERAKQELKKHQNECNALAIQAIYDIFPELKESEDERIRKGLIKGLSAMRDIHKHQTFSDDAININDAIAWLEKQDEKLHVDWNEKRKGLDELETYILSLDPNRSLDAVKVDAKNIRFLVNNGQQPKTTPQWMIDFLDEYRRKIGCSMDYDEIRDIDGKILAIVNWMKGNPNIQQQPTPKFRIGDTIHKIGENTVFPMTIEKIEDGDYVCNNSHSFVNIKFQDDYELVEQNNSWSEEDEEMLERCIDTMSMTAPNLWKKEIDWLKSLKDRVRPQTKQEWSKEDVEMIDAIVADILFTQKAHNHEVNQVIFGKEIDWLKSLRPQNRWKPSEEQLNEIKEAIGVTGTNGIVLLSLYNDLKKL